MQSQHNHGRAAARAQMLSALGAQMLRAKADEIYRGDHHVQSVDLYQQLVDLAARNGNTADEADNRFWLGTALHGSGRLVEAAAAMAPAMDQASFTGGRVLRARLLTRYILVAVDIPLPLARIETALNQVGELLHSWNWEDRESRLCMARSRLALNRGHRKDALRWSRLAMERFPRDPAAYASHAYLVGFYKACTATGRHDLLRECLDGWFRHADLHFRTNRRMVENLANADLCLGEGNLAQALALSELAEEGAWLTEDHVYRALGLSGRVRIVLEAGRPELARPILPALLRLRHTEVGHDRFDFRMLVGDYHLAEAKGALAGEASRRADAARSLGAAERCYRRAKAAGKVIDARLRCHGNRNLANRQLREVAELRS